MVIDKFPYTQKIVVALMKKIGFPRGPCGNCYNLMGFFDTCTISDLLRIIS